jgi:hypothetical protein
MRRETPRCLSAPCVVYDVRSFRYVNLNSTARACRIKFDVIRTFFQTTAVASGRRAVLPRGVEEVEPLRKLGEPFSAERSPARSRASFGDVARITAWPVREPSPGERESQRCRREHRIRTSEMPRGCRSADRSARARQAPSAPRAARAGFEGRGPGRVAFGPAVDAPKPSLPGARRLFPAREPAFSGRDPAILVAFVQHRHPNSPAGRLPGAIALDRRRGARQTFSRDGGSSVAARRRRFGFGGGSQGKRDSFRVSTSSRGETPGPPGSRNFGGHQ